MSLPYSLNPKDAITYLDERLTLSTPASAFQYVDVTFPASANTDCDIAHTLNTSVVDYVVAGWKFAAAPVTVPVIYRDTSGTARAWTNTYLTLRCNVASAVATLLLTARH